jgi:hypothetical protein
VTTTGLSVAGALRGRDGERIVDQLRASYMAAARAYWDHMTVETSSGRQRAWLAAARAGVLHQTVRDWDTAVAEAMFADLFASARRSG